MSNVDVVSQGYAAVARRDFEGALATIHPEVELYTPFAQLEGMVLRGHDGFRQWLRTLDETWGDWAFEVARYIDLGDRVAAIVDFQGRSRETGMTLDQPLLMAWAFEDGLARRLDLYLHVNDGLQALGVEPERA